MSGAPLSAAVARFAAELPFESAERLAAAIEHAPDRATADRRSTGLSAHPRFTERRDALFAAWTDVALPPPAVALALRASARSTRDARSEVRLEPVWTGPGIHGSGFRGTEQVLLELIRGASQRLLLVSYAVYRHSVLQGALVEAASRGVAIDVVAESEKESEGKMTADTLGGLGPEVLACSTVYVWPAGKRSKDSKGRSGVLHAKCGLADREQSPRLERQPHRARDDEQHGTRNRRPRGGASRPGRGRFLRAPSAGHPSSRRLTYFQPSASGSARPRSGALLGTIRHTSADRVLPYRGPRVRRGRRRWPQVL